MEERILRILSEEDHGWFTALLKGEQLHRYVVAFTDNLDWTVQSLACQAKYFWLFYDNLTLGWRTDPQDKSVVVDVGTSTDNFLLAWAWKTHYNQKAVRDSWLGIWIF